MAFFPIDHTQKSQLTQPKVLLSWSRRKFIYMTRGDDDIEGGLQKFLHTRRGDSDKIVGLGEGL